jgi:hypothetical protein
MGGLLEASRPPAARVAAVPALKDAVRVGNELKLDWAVVPPPVWQEALGVELEHGSRYGPKTDATGDDLLLTGRIALAHLMEDPFYYQRLGPMEAVASEYWRGVAHKPSPVVLGGFGYAAPPRMYVLLLALIVVLVVLIAAWALLSRARQKRQARCTKAAGGGNTRPR